MRRLEALVERQNPPFYLHFLERPGILRNRIHLSSNARVRRIDGSDQDFIWNRAVKLRGQRAGFPTLQERCQRYMRHRAKYHRVDRNGKIVKILYSPGNDAPKSSVSRALSHNEDPRTSLVHEPGHPTPLGRSGSYGNSESKLSAPANSRPRRSSEDSEAVATRASGSSEQQHENAIRLAARGLVVEYANEEEMQEDLDAVRRRSEKIVDEFREMRGEWEEWFDKGNYRRVLEQHKRREGPDLKGWVHDCSRSEFEGQYIREGSRRTGNYLIAERRIKYIFEYAADLGIEAYDWQDWAFPQGDAHYYLSDEERAMAATAPVGRIAAWTNAFPAHVSGFRPQDEEPAKSEVPEDVQLEDVEEPEVWDSYSLTAEKSWKEKIQKANEGRSGGYSWTWTPECRLPGAEE
jgi:hypothetical protein